MNEIKIIIENLKKINKLEFVLKLEKGICAIVGNNGSGKSSLITCIAKLVKPSILKYEFIGNYHNAQITYITPSSLEIKWKKDPNWFAVDNKHMNMPTYKGFFESSILTGTRFFHLDNKDIVLKHQDIENSKIASGFIKENLDYIINRDKSKWFDNLYYTKDFKNRIYFLKFDDKIVTEFNMSTGEYFLLSVLKIIQTFANRKLQDELRLLIIDEIDIALHPLAQKRFIEKLKAWMDEFNLLIVFASHSLQILENLDADNIYYLENDKIANPIYPAFLTSKLFKHISYDRIVLVEDDLADRFVSLILKKFNTERIAYKIVPIGGWEKVLEIYLLNQQYKYFGNAKVMTILDGDIQTEASKGTYQNTMKHFLPFSNIEIVCVELLLDCDKFRASVEKDIYPLKLIELDISELKTNEKFANMENKKTENIKNIFKKLIREISKHSRQQEVEIKNRIVEFIFDKYKEDCYFKKLEKNLKSFF